MLKPIGPVLADVVAKAKDFTISERLARLGFTHQSDGTHSGRRWVIHSATEAKVARLDAFDAAKLCEWLEA